MKRKERKSLIFTCSRYINNLWRSCVQSFGARCSSKAPQSWARATGRVAFWGRLDQAEFHSIWTYTNSYHTWHFLFWGPAMHTAYAADHWAVMRSDGLWWVTLNPSLCVCMCMQERDRSGEYDQCSSFCANISHRLEELTSTDDLTRVRYK